VLRAAGSRVYVPVDIAADFLDQTAARLRQTFPDLMTIPLAADFTMDFALPDGLVGPRGMFFPGSTIGNLDSLEAHELLLRMHRHAGPGGRAVIGIDLKKDVDVLLPAYDDARGSPPPSISTCSNGSTASWTGPSTLPPSRMRPGGTP
jgi:uncharacterized SAM-dependent methyltransferase